MNEQLSIWKLENAQEKPDERRARMEAERLYNVKLARSLRLYARDTEFGWLPYTWHAGLLSFPGNVVSEGEAA